ncbi:unnamed protein product [Timema podura]|uniref:Uncharacterized protein n=1 Tax=Timema podura TaxID=61482 RepID=A0ABN7NL64_TIMPD|nr:unnamed protein product [Timema podura]
MKRGYLPPPRWPDPAHWRKNWDYPNEGPPRYHSPPLSTEYERPPPYYYPGPGRHCFGSVTGWTETTATANLIPLQDGRPPPTGAPSPQILLFGAKLRFQNYVYKPLAPGWCLEAKKVPGDRPGSTTALESPSLSIAPDHHATSIPATHFSLLLDVFALPTCYWLSSVTITQEDPLV